jgi:hypothetical protein
VGEVNVSDGTPVDLSKLSIAELFALYGGILRELLARKIVRTANAPAGDYAEYLVAAALQGELVTSSEKGHDVSANGRRIQVKSRVVASQKSPGQRQLGVIRTFGFDDLAIVLFAADYSVWKAVLVPGEFARQRSTYRKYVNGNVLFATDALLADAGVTDLTERLLAASQPQRPIVAKS